MVRVHLLLPVRNFALRNNKKEVEQCYFLFYCLLWLVASLFSCKRIVRSDVALRFTALTAALRTDESTCFYHSIIQANQLAWIFLLSRSEHHRATLPYLSANKVGVGENAICKANTLRGVADAPCTSPLASAEGIELFSQHHYAKMRQYN